MERVVVTGMGVVSPLGCDVASYWNGLLEGRSGVVALEEKMYQSMRSRIGGQVTGYEEQDHFDHKDARRMSTSAKFGIVAARQALKQAGWPEKPENPFDIGVMIGSSIGGYAASDHYYKRYYRKGHTNPLIIPVSMNSGPSSNASIQFGFRGPVVNLDAACASGSHSIGYAYRMIQCGSIKSAIAGGADTCFSEGVYAAWGALRATSDRNDNPAEACRPFSADRDGLVLGEGAGVLTLEAESVALERGARILGEIKGFAATGDSYHITKPEAEGPAEAMRRALVDGGLSPEKIDHINAHGTGTKLNDANETSAIKMVFGERALRIPVVANKAGLGHSIAGSAALEVICSLLSIAHQRIPPLINYKVPDPECDLDLVTEGVREVSIRNVMKNSFAFGGSNAVLIIGKYEPAGE